MRIEWLSQRGQARDGLWPLLFVVIFNPAGIRDPAGHCLSEREMPTQRLFFALWPDHSLRERLHALTPSVLHAGSGRQVSRDNLHVTLVFLGSVDVKTRDCVEQMASEIRGQAFTLILDQLGYWPKPRILWVGASRLPEELRCLVGALTTRLVACGLSPEKREYRAHATLARKVKKRPKAGPIDPIDWQVDHFVLVESCPHPTGASYQVLRSWNLD